MCESARSRDKVSVITVVYNAVDLIEDTVRSVLGQDYDNVEYVVIDGGSTDGTLDVLKRYADRISYLVSERDEGIYDAMNKGVKAATGEWIGIMNAGDAFTSADTLSTIFGHGDVHDGVDVIYGDCVALDGGQRLFYQASRDMSGMNKGPVYRQGASFVRRAVHLRFLFDLSRKEQLTFALDFAQMYEMYKAGCVFKKVNVTVLDYERRGASTVSPFKPGYYDYLITHDMKCSLLMRGCLIWLACWQKLMSILTGSDRVKEPEGKRK